jgi:phospholipid transport system transporter-binding protein
MSGASLVNRGDGTFGIRGSLDFGSVTELLSQGERHFAEISPLVIDLREVTRANSAGMALLLEWLDRARGRKQVLRYLNLPGSLIEIAAFTNVISLLPIDHE